jgi:hypothetical protein
MAVGSQSFSRRSICLVDLGPNRHMRDSRNCSRLPPVRLNNRKLTHYLTSSPLRGGKRCCCSGRVAGVELWCSKSGPGEPGLYNRKRSPKSTVRSDCATGRREIWVRGGAGSRRGTSCDRGEGGRVPSAYDLWATRQLRVTWPNHAPLADFPLPISISILYRGWISTSPKQHVHTRQFLISKKHSSTTQTHGIN